MLLRGNLRQFSVIIPAPLYRHSRVSGNPERR